MKNLFNKLKNKEIKNVYSTNFRKNVLISYIVSPLKIKNRFNHSNQQELITITKVFKDLGFNVDVYHYLSNKKINYQKYSLIFGFGNPFSSSFAEKNIKRIYYGTGAHPYFQNYETLKRVDEFFNKKETWLLESSRKVNYTWPEQLQLSDVMILLGNKYISATYEKYFNKKIYLINSTYNTFLDKIKTTKQSNKETKRSFLYFTSNGALHRSLDLLIEYFIKHPELNLYIASNFEKEINFLEIYKNELKQKNIELIGYLNINSEKYLNLINKCDFTILPTCSEGQSTSLINMMRSGLIPITTIYSGLENLEDLILIKDNNLKSIDNAIKKSQKLTLKEINFKRNKLINYSKENYSLKNYENSLKTIILEIINEN